jgi:nucleoside-diphosphate-sugar epimerase
MLMLMCSLVGAKLMCMFDSFGDSGQPQDAYGLEKLATEELCKHYTKDFKMECRIGRFHNIYGPFGTWKGNQIPPPPLFKSIKPRFLQNECSPLYRGHFPSVL